MSTNLDVQKRTNAALSVEHLEFCTLLIPHRTYPNNTAMYPVVCYPCTHACTEM